MPNPYFSFKQFTIYHDRCAMKVGTDGVLLGAWADVSDTNRILDIGSGSGLIALMIAQRNNTADIDAIEIDKEAALQAAENINKSPFCSQIKCFNISLTDYSKKCRQKYDLIVSNPPFFEQSLKSPHKGRTTARHTDTLSAEELIQTSADLLSQKGRLAVIYPFSDKENLINEATMNGLYLSRYTIVYPTPTSLPKRILIEFSKTKYPLKEDTLVIEKERHIYSDDFSDLVRDYYLKL